MKFLKDFGELSSSFWLSLFESKTFLWVYHSPEDVFAVQVVWLPGWVQGTVDAQSPGCGSVRAISTPATAWASVKNQLN